MVYKTDRLLLSSVREVLSGPVNDVLICEETGRQDGSYYTLLVIREHTAARRMLQIYEQAKEQGRKAEAEIFSCYGDLCLAYEYRPERPLEQFFRKRSYSLQEAELICSRLLLECMACLLPYPLLYLILSQNQIHIRRDGAVYFSYQLDLSELDAGRGEKACAACAGAIVQSLLEPCSGRNTASYQLLRRRLDKGSYESLMDVYHDVKLTASPQKGIRLFWSIRELLQRQQDRLFWLMLVLCLLLAVLALLLIISQIIWGDIPLLRLLQNPFRIIGTESLLQ